MIMKTNVIFVEKINISFEVFSCEIFKFKVLSYKIY